MQIQILVPKARPEDENPFRVAQLQGQLFGLELEKASLEAELEMSRKDTLFTFYVAVILGALSFTLGILLIFGVE